MRSTLIAVLSYILIGWNPGFADMPGKEVDGRIGINKMFVDAHAPDYPQRHSRSELSSMMRNARTSQDYARLADYFDFQTMELEQKYQDQERELHRLVALPYHAKSYPAQIDSIRAQMKSLKYQEQECSTHAADYRQHAFAGNTEK